MCNKIFLCGENKVPLTHSLQAEVGQRPVTLRINCCKVLYVVLHSKAARKLKLMQNAATCMLMGTGRLELTTPILQRRDMGSL